MTTAVRQTSRLETLNGELSGGDFIVVDNYADLGALQALCGLQDLTVEKLRDYLVLADLKAKLFPELREDWAANSGRYHTDLHDYIERFYNRVRRHSTLGNISPVMYELKHAA